MRSNSFIFIQQTFYLDLFESAEKGAIDMDTTVSQQTSALSRPLIFKPSEKLITNLKEAGYVSNNRSELDSYFLLYNEEEFNVFVFAFAFAF